MGWYASFHFIKVIQIPAPASLKNFRYVLYHTTHFLNFVIDEIISAAGWLAEERAGCCGCVSCLRYLEGRCCDCGRDVPRLPEDMLGCWWDRADCVFHCPCDLGAIVGYMYARIARESLALATCGSLIFWMRAGLIRTTNRYKIHFDMKCWRCGLSLTLYMNLFIIKNKT